MAMGETESTTEVYELYQRGIALLERGDFAAAAVECYSAISVAGDRAKALATLSDGAAIFSEARARVAAAES